MTTICRQTLHESEPLFMFYKLYTLENYEYIMHRNSCMFLIPYITHTDFI